MYNGLFVMRDRQSGSVWTHYEGKVLFGPLAGQDLQMEYIMMAQTPWSEWLALHPETLVLDYHTGFEEYYIDNLQIGEAGLGRRVRETLSNLDTRLPEFELILGVEVNAEYRAYVRAEMAPGTRVINDMLGGSPIVILSGSGGEFAAAFSRTINGQILAFESDGTSISDDQGNSWSLEGRCISGPLTGQSLEPVQAFLSEWYGWAAYHPTTTIFGR